MSTVPNAVPHSTDSTEPGPAPVAPADIRRRFAQARAGGLRHRDAAASIGLSEGAVVAAHVRGAGDDEAAAEAGLQARPLVPRWAEVLSRLQGCGPLMALTRNEHVVHEKIGPYGEVSGEGPVGLLVGELIDLRLFFSQWHAGFAVREAGAGRGGSDSLSLQFFDRRGTAVHKIYAHEGTDRAALEAAIDASVSSEPAAAFEAPAALRAIEPGSGVPDVEALAQAWGAMQDTHEFFGLLKRFGVERQQSFRLMQGRYATALHTEALHALLSEAAGEALPIMCFVANPGCIQIHTGPVQRIALMGPWLNVLDAGFNLHLNQTSLAHVWRVEKPTADGIVTSVEAFDERGELMVMFFGARKPGVPESPAWRRLAQDLPLAQGSALEAA